MTPDTYTISEQFLDVGDGHQLYIQEWGCADAQQTVLFLHGGPGGGCSDGYKQMFDPTRQRVIFFDQRGAGRSLPKGSLEQNTTADLVEDIRKILEHFGLTQVIITGGSWGSCLALAYGLKYPETVSAMVLRGIYTGSQSENDYLDNGLFRTFFPDVWQAYLDRTPPEHHANPTAFHVKQLASGNPDKIKASAYAYSELEGSLLALDDRHTPQNYEDFDPDAMKIELHYLQNGCFMPDRFILENAAKLTMPIWLVQGRYDAVCPPITAYELDQKLPNSELMWTVAGHRGSDRAIYDVMRTLLLTLTRR